MGRVALVLQLAGSGFAAEQPAGEVVEQLTRRLHQIRRSLDVGTWHALVPLIQSHSISAYLEQDPFTRRSVEKPRGYSGDAHLIDFIYGHPSIQAEVASATPLGREIFDFTANSPSAIAVRQRRDLLTELVDQESAARGPGIEILTVAAGSLREAEQSSALKEGRIGRWVGLDQDPLSVGTIVRNFAGTVVEGVDGSVRDLLMRRQKLGQFDLVYSAGLYDYLAHGVAVKLTQRCVEFLKPGGTFLFANFSTDLWVDGYMETFMDWSLLWRSEADMWAIINQSVDRNAVDVDVFAGENGCILYGRITRKA